MFSLSVRPEYIMLETEFGSNIIVYVLGIRTSETEKKGKVTTFPHSAKPNKFSLL